MQRGELDGDIDEPAEVTIPTPINDGELVQSQTWPQSAGLDRRGNWVGFDYETKNGAASQTRTRNGANEYGYIDTTVGEMFVQQLLTHDAAGNLTRIDLVGDLNCDGEVNLLDVNAFSLALSDSEDYAAAYPGCNSLLGDVNRDGVLNVSDINAFSALLSAGNTGQARRFGYDEENRLVTVLQTDGTPLLEIAYDALGRRVLTKDHVGGCGTGFQPVKTRHVYAGIEVLEEHACCDGEEAGGLPDCESEDWTLAREFLWGDRFPEPLVMIDFTDAGDVPAAGTTGGGAETLHFVRDSLGSVIGLLDAGDPEATPTPIPPKMVERYEYDPYGRTYVEAWDQSLNSGAGDWVRLTPVSGATAAASRLGNPFAWTGQRYDAGVGMYHFLFRSYSPELGRWMQRDPLGYVGADNLFQYVLSSPLTWLDPLGLCEEGSGPAPAPPADVPILPLVPKKCLHHLKEILGLANNLRDEIRNYNPEADPGGKSFDKSGRKTRPGGHGQKYRDKQNRLRNKIDEYDRDCRPGGAPPLPKEVTDVVDMPIPQAQPTGGPAPARQPGAPPAPAAPQQPKPEQPAIDPVAPPKPGAVPAAAGGGSILGTIFEFGAGLSRVPISLMPIFIVDVESDLNKPKIHYD